MPAKELNIKAVVMKMLKNLHLRLFILFPPFNLKHRLLLARLKQYNSFIYPQFKQCLQKNQEKTSFFLIFL